MRPWGRRRRWLVTYQGYCRPAKLLQDDRLVQEGPKKPKKKPAIERSATELFVHR